jgi:hypothetical protein
LENPFGSRYPSPDAVKLGEKFVLRIVERLEPTLADEIEDNQTGYLIERALDAARSRQFRLIG